MNSRVIVLIYYSNYFSKENCKGIFMNKILSALFLILLLSDCTYAAECTCSYRMQKKMLHNHKMIRNKVINAQVKGKMLAIQELAAQDNCNDPKVRAQILNYQKQIEDLTNQKLCLKKEYKQSLTALKAKY